MALLKVGPAVFEFHGGKLAPQNLHDEVAAPARRLQKAGINALRLVFYQIEHRVYHPCRSEYLSVVSNALL
jgi:hypothetical protein